MPVQDLTRATRQLRQLVPAWFEHYGGLASAIVFVDRAAGVLGSIFWYDSLHVLRGSALRTRQLRDLLVADVPAMQFVEDVELEVVIAEMGELFGSEPTHHA
jgi:hypothetical protein